MRDAAEKSVKDHDGFSQLLLAIAASDLGDRDTTRRALDTLSRYKVFMDDPRDFILRHGLADELVAALLVGFDKARAFADGA